MTILFITDLYVPLNKCLAKLPSFPVPYYRVNTVISW